MEISAESTVEVFLIQLVTDFKKVSFSEQAAPEDNQELSRVRLDLEAANKYVDQLKEKETLEKVAGNDRKKDKISSSAIEPATKPAEIEIKVHEYSTENIKMNVVIRKLKTFSAKGEGGDKVPIVRSIHGGQNIMAIHYSNGDTNFVRGMSDCRVTEDGEKGIVEKSVTLETAILADKENRSHLSQDGRYLFVWNNEQQFVAKEFDEYSIKKKPEKRRRKRDMDDGASRRPQAIEVEAEALNHDNDNDNRASERDNDGPVSERNGEEGSLIHHRRDLVARSQVVEETAKVEPPGNEVDGEANDDAPAAAVVLNSSPNTPQINDVDAQSPNKEVNSKNISGPKKIEYVELGEGEADFLEDSFEDVEVKDSGPSKTANADNKIEQMLESEVTVYFIHQTRAQEMVSIKRVDADMKILTPEDIDVQLNQVEKVIPEGADAEGRVPRLLPNSAAVDRHELDEGSPEQQTHLFKFKIPMHMEYMKSTKDFLIFYGTGGYQMYTIHHRNTRTTAEDKAVSLPVFTRVRTRTKESYRLSNENLVEISPCGEHVAIAFPVSGVTVLFNLHHLSSNDGTLITSKNLTKCRNLDQFEFVFQFDKMTCTKENLSTGYLSVMDYSNSLRKNIVKVFNLSDNSFFSAGAFASTLMPLYIEFEYEQVGARIQSISIDLVKLDHSLADLNFLRRLVSNMEQSYYMPFHFTVKTNIVRYYKAGSSSVQAEQFYFNLLTNTLKAIPLDMMLSDPRALYLVFMMDKQGFLESILDEKLNLNSLFSVLKLFELVFNPDLPQKQLSIQSVSTIFKEYVKKKKYPTINEKFAQSLFLGRNENIATNIHCRYIISQVLFADCHISIVGMVYNKYRSIVPINEADSNRTTYTRWFVENKVKPIMEDKPQKTNEYKVYRSRMKIDLSNGSEASLRLFETIHLLPDEEVRYKYRQLINYKWKMVFWYSFVYSVVYYIMNILAYIYFGYQTSLMYGAPIVILNLAFILYDLKCFGSEWRIFLKDLNNWLDILVHGVSIAAVVILQLNILSGLHAYAKLLAITTISVRGITLLKMFGPLRMLVYLIGQILVDLLWVPPVMGMILLLAATLFKMANIPGAGGETNLSFLQCVQEVFFLMFMSSNSDIGGAVAAVDVATIIRNIVVVLLGALLAQGIFNFVIAIFVQTFKKVSDDREIYEIRGLILDIRDVDLFLRGFNMWSKGKPEYYMFLVPIPKNGKINENESEFEKVTKMAGSLMAEAAKKGMKKAQEQAKKLVPGAGQQIDQAFDGLVGLAPEADPSIKSIIGVAEKLEKGERVSIEDAKNSHSSDRKECICIGWRDDA